jgi:CBS domain-containing protein
MTTSIRLPRVSVDHDIIDTFSDFHEAMRDVAAWIPTIVDEKGDDSPRDARWLRAFLRGPLAWHFHDEEHVVMPWLSLRQSDWLNACLARTTEKHAEIRAHADELMELLEPLCMGEAVPRLRFLNAARRFQHAVENDLRYEDDIMLPSSRVFLDASERASIAREIATADGSRPWEDVAVAGDTPVLHRVHTVRARNAVGLDIVYSFADCPRRRATSIDACAGCPHLVDKQVASDGSGHVACAIDDAPMPKDKRVSDVMTRDVVCIERDAPLSDAARLLATACVSGLPVVDEHGRALGVVSQSDIVDAVAEGADIAARTVRDAMMHAPIVVQESDTIEDAARLLLMEGIHRLPVVNAERSVVGIISTLDLLRATIGKRPTTETIAGGAS